MLVSRCWMLDARKTADGRSQIARSDLLKAIRTDLTEPPDQTDTTHRVSPPNPCEPLLCTWHDAGFPQCQQKAVRTDFADRPDRADPTHPAFPLDPCEPLFLDMPQGTMSALCRIRKKRFARIQVNIRIERIPTHPVSPLDPCEPPFLKVLPARCVAATNSR
jgi:hypothetical protein